jgi:hypothetical protein
MQQITLLCSSALISTGGYNCIAGAISGTFTLGEYFPVSSSLQTPVTFFGLLTLFRTLDVRSIQTESDVKVNKLEAEARSRELDLKLDKKAEEIRVELFKELFNAKGLKSDDLKGIEERVNEKANALKEKPGA